MATTPGLQLSQCIKVHISGESGSGLLFCFAVRLRTGQHPGFEFNHLVVVPVCGGPGHSRGQYRDTKTKVRRPVVVTD